MLVDLLLSQQHVVFGLRQEATMSKARFQPTLPVNWYKFAMKEDLLYSKDTLKIYSSLLRWVECLHTALGWSSGRAVVAEYSQSKGSEFDY